MKKYLLMIVTILSLMFMVSAFALSLGQAKSKGWVKETSSGYLRATNSQARSLVNSVNSQRRATYRRIAKNTGASVSVVERRAGRKLAR